MEEAEVYGLFNPLWDDLKKRDTFPEKRPLLAHYTTIQTVEKIIQNSEVWFGNPLYMNDLEEVRFGLFEGDRLFRSTPDIAKACGSQKRAEIMFRLLTYWHQTYLNEHLADTYVFCTSLHKPDDNDGLLSMWRGYGGNGNGAAIVIDTTKLTSIEQSPLIIAKVEYGNHNDRRAWIEQTRQKFCKILSESNIPDDKLHIPAYALHERLKLFALCTKHIGFSEEQEWRMTCPPEVPSL